MEEKNELNDIILNKSGSGSNSKKLLLAIAALTLILIIVLVIMNSLKTQTEEQPPHAAVPPTPTAPTEIVDDPLFEPVEVIQEGGNETSAQDLGKIAQKIKQESFQNTQPEQPKAVSTSTPAPQAKPTEASAPAPVAAAPKAEVKPAVAKPAVVKSAPKAPEPVVNTPTIKNVKPVVPKKVVETKKTAVPETKTSAVTAPKTAEKPAAKSAADTEGTYYIQVGSFSKDPNKALFDRLNASGLKYITVPSGTTTKVMVGPFQGEKAARDVLGTVRKNIEAGAYITGK
ncbi:MAG: SPOR domain-containing protein [Sulfuricurvum sp.]|uniref:SPOR domain-containing protein n=1 Tax=Sulfuricurvum sp. TaxID=2025608 RepID=UPI0026305E44|nr:SPOR domain-containing protein [Sulfuricurvum sp.]MDD2368212.1 SPOR domain-containing protein [Sulfuricurvum sp.]MDD5117415.1 SPOR domain-containing protein [Sulfuricurvum sp.]